MDAVVPAASAQIDPSDECDVLAFRTRMTDQDDLLVVVRRVEALGKFLDTDDGKNLLAGTKRGANILRIEEKKDGKDGKDDKGDKGEGAAEQSTIDPSLMGTPDDYQLARAVDMLRGIALFNGRVVN